MEKNIYTDNFERMLKERSDEFKMIPSKRVWHGIYNDLHPSRRWPSVAVSIFLIAALLLAGYLNTENNNNSNVKKTAANNKTVNPGQGTSAGQSSKDLIAANTGIPVNTNVFSIADAAAITGNIQQANQQTTGKINDINPATGLPATQTAGNKPAGSAKNNTRPALSGNSNNATANSRNIISNGTVAITKNSNTSIENGISMITDAVEEADNNTNGFTSPKTSLTEEKNIIASLSSGSANNTLIAPADKKVSASATSAQNGGSVTPEQKAWMEAFVLHNKKAQKKWKGKLSWEAYLTPSFTFRKLSSNSKFNTNNITTASKPSLGLEAGGTLVYAFAKNFRLKTGLQFNYTNYNIDAWETNHPVLTTLTLNDPTSGYPYVVSRSTSLTTAAGGIAPVKLHSNTFQVSAVAGLDVKLYGTENIQWYAGATIQPSYILGGKVYLLSSDHNNYVAENSMLRKFNLAGGFETFVSYKSGSYTWQVGPQLRYQFMSTYDKKYNQKENLINTGIKVGIIKLL